MIEKRTLPNGGFFYLQASQMLSFGAGATIVMGSFLTGFIILNFMLLHSPFFYL